MHDPPNEETRREKRGKKEERRFEGRSRKAVKIHSRSPLIQKKERVWTHPLGGGEQSEQWETKYIVARRVRCKRRRVVVGTRKIVCNELTLLPAAKGFYSERPKK